METSPQTDQLIATTAGTTRSSPPPPVPDTKLPPIPPSQESVVEESADVVSASTINNIASSKSRLVARAKSTAPRVPSALRMVVDAKTMDKLHTMKDASEYNNNIQEPQVAITVAQLSAETVDEDMFSPPTGSHALHILKTPSSPSLRWSHHTEPSIQELVTEKRTDSNCYLPYPPLPDNRNSNSIVPKARAQSLNTLSGASSYHLSIITEGQDYTIYSPKKGHEVAIRPSVIRGWTQYIRGKIAYSFGQAIASPTLITRGNSYMWKGTAQMQLSKQKKQQDNSKQAKEEHRNETKRKLERRKSLLARASKGGGPQQRRPWRNGRRCSIKSTSVVSDLGHEAKDDVVGVEERPLSVAQMVAAAQDAADMEILEESSVGSYAEHTPSSTGGQPSQNNSSETANVSLGSVSDTISPDTLMESSPKELSSPTQSEVEEDSFIVTTSPVSVSSDHGVSSSMQVECNVVGN